MLRCKIRYLFTNIHRLIPPITVKMTSKVIVVLAAALILAITLSPIPVLSLDVFTDSFSDSSKVSSSTGVLISG